MLPVHLVHTQTLKVSREFIQTKVYLCKQLLCVITRWFVFPFLLKPNLLLRLKMRRSSLEMGSGHTLRLHMLPLLQPFHFHPRKEWIMHQRLHIA